MLRIEPLPLKDQKNFYALPHRKRECGGAHDVHCFVDKPLVEFERVMEYTGFELRYVKSGANGHTFFASKDGGATRCAVKIVPYPAEGYGDSIDDAAHPVNVEVLMLRLLSQYVTDGRCPHVVAPFITFNTPAESFVRYVAARGLRYTERGAKESHPLAEQPAYKKFVERVQSGALRGTLSVLFSEWADRGDLLDYLKSNYLSMQPLVWKVLFFQIVAMLACIQQKFPNFKHNDLKANNVLVKTDSSGHRSYKYTIYGKSYMIPNVGLCVKFWDFDFSCIQSVIDNRKLDQPWAARMNITPKKNLYYDLHFFFNSLKHFVPALKCRSKRVPAEVFQFIDSVVPADELVKCHVTRERVRVPREVVEEVPRSKMDSVTGEFVTAIERRCTKKTVTEMKTKPTYRMIGNFVYTHPEMLLTHSPYFAEFRL